MSRHAQDELPLSEAHSRLTELAEEVVTGTEKVLTKNGLPYVAIIDVRKLDYYHALEAEHVRLVMLEDFLKGLEDVLACRVQTEDEFRNSVRRSVPRR
ncbi:type II toxin-antitoxin system prevent-host-death family antitoxin [Paraburkholderia sp. JPY432]|uniref:type II toxin-antitoxin system prevent-host-death family antitoxin n=1 Tax=Paraburkholderia youngii TaxID=2782701 RepID=UPI00159602A8|nr:type II toxin-antitoxin system prevent-host-death family antitoxin [Paraburkholderia youngii]NVH75741.1 type II toxin-antitoxin system prevent-host-death family antitoxin [Paraburkholderia youngii]